jgi:hypothetical protein
MFHYTFSATFRAVHERAAARVAKGGATAANLLDAADVAFLAANGITAQHLFDYVDDLANYGEPSFDHAHGIELVRRDYFLNAQDGRPSSITLDVAAMPAKSATVRGISWLPRLLPKARAKLRGELPPADAARLASAELRALLPSNAEGVPVLDLVFLGMGEDGHVASLFPGAPDAVVHSREPVLDVIGPKPPPQRLTLGFTVLAAAREVWVLASGAGKEEALRLSLASGLQTPLARLLSLRPQTRIFTDIAGA